jgi:hypothetical protein
LIVMSLVLIASVAVIFMNRPQITEQRAVTNTYHTTRAEQAASGGLAWVMANLNGPKPAGRVCVASGQAPWKAACEWTEQGSLACDCAAPGNGDAVGPGVGFRVAVSRVAGPAPQPGAEAMLNVSVAGCSVPAGRETNTRCSAAEGATFSVLETRLRFVPLLGRMPNEALTAGGPITMPQSGMGDPAFGGYVMGVFTPPPAPETVSASDTGHAPLRDKVLGVSKAALRDAAFRVTCNGECSEPLRRAVQSGHAVLWVDGDLQLVSVLALGSDEHPVLLWVDGEVRVGPRVSLTGLLLARSVEWTASEEGYSHFRGAVVADGAIAVTGSPAIEWAPEVLSRLVATSGWFEPIPGWTKAN